MKIYKNILYVVGDTMENSGNVKEYFIKQSDNFYLLRLAAYHSRRPSFFEYYFRSKKIFTIKIHFYKGDNWFLKYIFSLIYYYYVLFKYFRKSPHVDIIVIHPIHCLFNGFLSLFVKFRLVFWIWDYFPQKSGLMNIYHFLVNNYNTKLNHVLYLSPPIKKIYNINDNKIRILAPFGLKRKYSKLINKNKNTILLGFIGIVKKGQGLENLFNFLKQSRNILLEIIGEGPELSYYKSLAKEINIESKVKFWGFLEQYKLKNIFKKWDIGAALYDDSKMNVSKYCDPGKIKLFLEHGLPVITTKTTYFYKIIEKYHAGRIIASVTDLNQAVKDIKNDYESYLNGVNKIVKKYNFKTVYDNYFSFLK